MRPTVCVRWVDELPSTRGRGRKQAKKQSTSASAKQKVLNLNTYKYHRLGDYPQAVREFGPLDGYSTQTVCPISPIMASS